MPLTAEACYERALKLIDVAGKLKDKAGQLDPQYRPVRYYYDRHNNEFDIMCPGCEARMYSVYSTEEIPLLKDVHKCDQCLETPEEKAEEALKLKAAQDAADMKKFFELKEKLGM